MYPLCLVPPPPYRVGVSVSRLDWRDTLRLSLGEVELGGVATSWVFSRYRVWLHGTNGKLFTKINDMFNALYRYVYVSSLNNT